MSEDQPASLGADASASPRRKLRRSRRWTFGLAFGVLAIDQALKAIVDAVLPIGGVHVGPLFHLRRVLNPGMNFGLFADYPLIILIGTLVVGLGFSLYVLSRPPRRWWTIAGFALLLGGGFSNMLDRIRLGAVFDFLNITPFVGYLNLADLAIGAGIILLLLESLWPVGKPKTTVPERPSASSGDGSSPHPKD